MSVRSQFPAPKVSTSHYFLTISRGERIRQFAFRPWVLMTLGTFAPLAIVSFFAFSAYLVFRDDMLSAMLTRQSEMQYAYEDRLASMRAQLDRVTSRQLLDQDTLEGRVHELISRQAQIENRTSIIALLADQAGVSREATATIPRPEPRAVPPTSPTAKAAPVRGENPLLTQRPASGKTPPGVSAFAPISPGSLPLTEEKPRPEILDQRSDHSDHRRRSLAALANPDVPMETRLRTIVSSLESLEVSQVRAVSAIGGAARQTANRLRTAIAETGLSPEKLNLPANHSHDKPVGGPFIPLKADPKGSLFEREVYRLQNDFAAADKLRRLTAHLPLRKPLQGALDITSGFGGRADPFLGRLATHAGIDIRDPQGTPVRTTAAGRVITAGWSGGYGNMIEIDHGNGLTTRYAHLSAILVSEEQWVEAGWIVGKLGSTGRSTGPHLHYEVRINGEAVDPQRFLRAGGKMLAGG